MSGTPDHPVSPFGPLQATLEPMRSASLEHTIDDVDLLVKDLEQARHEIAQGHDMNHMCMKLLALQNPVKARCEAVTEDLKKVTKAQKAFAKVLDKTLPVRDIPMDMEMMAEQSDLINAAVGMHMLREGQFQAASTFQNESRARHTADTPRTAHRTQRASSHVDRDGDDDMRPDEDAAHENDEGGAKLDERHKFHESFQRMFRILEAIEKRNLQPAIQWTRQEAQALKSRGSNLGFELTRLQYIWLFKGPAVNGLPDDERNGVRGATAYARENLSPFMAMHPKDVQQLCTAVIYAPNLSASPYARLFDLAGKFEEVAHAFTRDFCGLLGLSAESPLYVATTAGAIALPNLIKYNAYMKAKRTEWTSTNELAFETPLPPSMIYHSIFVCPVSKEQTTAQNPAVIMPCGHVISTDSLSKMTKRQGSRVKCPYCPWEGPVKETQEILF